MYRPTKFEVLHPFLYGTFVRQTDQLYFTATDRILIWLHILTDVFVNLISLREVIVNQIISGTLAIE